MPRISHAMDSPRIGRRTNVFWSCASRGVTIRERSSQSAKRKEARLRRRFPADVSVKIHYRSRPRTRPHVRVPGSRGNRKLPASYELISCICKEMRWNRRKVSLYIGLSRLRGNKFNCSPRIFSGLTDTHTHTHTEGDQTFVLCSARYYGSTKVGKVVPRSFDVLFRDVPPVNRHDNGPHRGGFAVSRLTYIRSTILESPARRRLIGPSI